MKKRVGYFGLEAGSLEEARAVAAHLSKQGDTTWVVVRLTYADGHVTHTADTVNIHARLCAINNTIKREALSTFANGEESAL